MSHDPTSGTDRRTFLQAGALATAAALGAAGLSLTRKRPPPRRRSSPGGSSARPASR